MPFNKKKYHREYQKTEKCKAWRAGPEYQKIRARLKHDYYNIRGKINTANHYQRWTVGEIELLSTDLTSMEVAHIIGRTVKAVEVMKSVLRKEDQ